MLHIVRLLPTLLIFLVDVEKSARLSYTHLFLVVARSFLLLFAWRKNYRSLSSVCNQYHHGHGPCFCCPNSDGPVRFPSESFPMLLRFILCWCRYYNDPVLGLMPLATRVLVSKKSAIDDWPKRKPTRPDPPGLELSDTVNT